MKVKLIKDYKVHKAGSDFQTDIIEGEYLLNNGYAVSGEYQVMVEIPKAQNKMLNTRPRKVKRKRKIKK